MPKLFTFWEWELSCYSKPHPKNQLAVECSNCSMFSVLIGLEILLKSRTPFNLRPSSLWTLSIKSAPSVHHSYKLRMWVSSLSRKRCLLPILPRSLSILFRATPAVFGNAVCCQNRWLTDRWIHLMSSQLQFETVLFNTCSLSEYDFDCSWRVTLPHVEQLYHMATPSLTGCMSNSFQYTNFCWQW